MKDRASQIFAYACVLFANLQGYYLLSTVAFITPGALTLSGKDNSYIIPVPSGNDIMPQDYYKEQDFSFIMLVAGQIHQTMISAVNSLGDNTISIYDLRWCIKVPIEYVRKAPEFPGLIFCG